MPSRSRQHRTRPTLSTPSLAQPALSLSLDDPHAPLDAPLAPSSTLRAAHRSPSPHSLASARTRDSAQSAPTRGGGRTASSSLRSAASSKPGQATASAQRASSSLGRSDTPSAQGDDDDDDDELALSRASSSSSLDGLAARLQGARAGKGQVQGPAREVSGRASPSPHKGKARLVDPPPPPAHDDSPPRTDLPALVAAAASTSYDLPRLAPSPAPTAPGASTSPSRADDDAAFARPPSPSASALDPDDDDYEFQVADDDEPEPDREPIHVPTARSAAHPHPQADPRSLLRAQLARAPSSSSSRTRARAGAEAGAGAGNENEKPALSRAASAGAGGEVKVRPVARRALVPRRYFILSTAGKLVWTSDQDDEAATGLAGVMQAIVSIFADEGDKLRYIDAGATRVSFLLKAPLYLVVVSSLGEPESVLRVHLDYLYLQVLSVVTQTQLEAIFARRSNFDLRRLMEGTEPFFASLASSLQTSFAILLSSIEVYRLAPSVRAQLARALDPGKDAVRRLDLLYVVLLCRGRLVTLLRPTRHSIHPTDLHLVLSTVYAPRPAPPPPPPPPGDGDGDQAPPRPPAPAPATRPSPLTAPDAETWLPICLPRFNARGFLHAYVSFLGGGAGASSETGLVVVSSQRDAFAGVREVASGIRARLGVGASSSSSEGAAGGAGEALHALEMAAARQAYSLGEVAVPGLRHFVYKDRGLVQVTAPRWEGEYAAEGGEGEGTEEREEEAERARMRLTTLYQHVHDALHPRPAAAGTAARPPAQVQYLRTEHEAVLGWVTPQFELYLATAPRLPHSAVVSAARAVSRWVKREEKGLFLHGAGTF